MDKESLKITPFGKNLWIKPIEKKQTIVSDDQTFTDYGEVMAVGDTTSGKIKVGDKIAYLFWGIQSVSIDGERYWILPESDEFLLFTL